MATGRLRFEFTEIQPDMMRQFKFGTELRRITRATYRRTCTVQLYDEMLLRIEPQGAEIWVSNSREDSIDRPYKSVARAGARADIRAPRLPVHWLGLIIADTGI